MKDKIYEAINKHHETVKSLGYNPIMTVLIGSQNYGLATENSDYDTFTFILPDVYDIATLNDPVSIKHEDEYGHINIKDIRLGLNLLKKTSPNSVECFASKYYVYESKYGDIIKRLHDPILLRCNTKHMMMAIGGMAHQLAKRNMSPGKQLSHILRMRCMVNNYFDIESDILSMSDDLLQYALEAKRDPDNKKWISKLPEEEKIVQDMISKVDMTYFEGYDDYAKKLIDTAQVEIMMRDLKNRVVVNPCGYPNCMDSECLTCKYNKIQYVDSNKSIKVPEFSMNYLPSRKFVFDEDTNQIVCKTLVNGEYR